MFCTNCGTTLQDGSVFCTNCGTPTGYQEQAGTPFQGVCRCCGAGLRQIGPNHFTCSNCGSEYFTNSRNELTREQKTERELWNIYQQAANLELANRPVDALQCLLSAPVSAYESAFYLTKLGRAYRRLNHYQKAIEMYERALSIDPNNATTYSNLGIIYLNSDPARAEHLCRTAISLANADRLRVTDSDYAVIYSNCAIAVGKNGQISEAKALLKIAEANGYTNGDAARKMIGIKKGLFR